MSLDPFRSGVCVFLERCRPPRVRTFPEVGSRPGWESGLRSVPATLSLSRGSSCFRSRSSLESATLGQNLVPSTGQQVRSRVSDTVRVSSRRVHVQGLHLDFAVLREGGVGPTHRQSPAPLCTGVVERVVGSRRILRRCK